MADRWVISHRGTLSDSARANVRAVAIHAQAHPNEPVILEEGMTLAIQEVDDGGGWASALVSAAAFVVGLGAGIVFWT